MPKDIVVVSYDLNPGSSMTSDAVVIRNTLNGNGYSAQLLHQWAFNETEAAHFKSADYWDKYDGVVICNFYNYWNLRELIRAGRPVVCVNVGYADDLGLGRAEQGASADNFNVVNNAHPITAGAGLPLGTFDIGSPVWTEPLSSHDHHVDQLVTTPGNQAVLVAHKTRPLAYFGWIRMSQASSGSPLFKLLVQTANWTFSGP